MKVVQARCSDWRLLRRAGASRDRKRYCSSCTASWLALAKVTFVQGSLDVSDPLAIFSLRLLPSFEVHPFVTGWRCHRNRKAELSFDPLFLSPSFLISAPPPTHTQSLIPAGWAAECCGGGKRGHVKFALVSATSFCRRRVRGPETRRSVRVRHPEQPGGSAWLLSSRENLSCSLNASSKLGLKGFLPPLSQCLSPAASLSLRSFSSRKI